MTAKESHSMLSYTKLLNIKENYIQRENIATDLCTCATFPTIVEEYERRFLYSGQISIKLYALIDTEVIIMSCIDNIVCHQWRCS